MYLNRVFFGSNAYGVEAAARRYFNKSARDVNLGEAALLAGLLKAPSRLSPARDPEAAEARAQVVLQAMLEEGYITDDEIKSAMTQPPTKAKRYWSGAGQYVADLVRDEVTMLIGQVTEDIVVETTIDMTLEKKAEAALTESLAAEGEKVNASQAALVSIDGTGAIRALVGGRDYAESQFNRAVKAKRQPGSAFKPFVYAAAVENGLRPSSVRNDAPIRIGSWTPENYDQKYRGPVSATQALSESLNTIAAQLVMEVGPDQVIKVAHRMGIESELQNNASIALGTSEVSLLELTAAYAPFMNGGYKATPYRAADLEGGWDAALREQLSRAAEGAERRRRICDERDDAQRHRPRNGQEGTACGLGGRRQDRDDAVVPRRALCGYTSNLTTGIWFGNDDGQSMKKVTGGGLPAKAWHDFMTAAHQGLAPAPLPGGDFIEPAPAEEPATIGTIISDVLQGGGEERYTGDPVYAEDYPAEPVPSGDVTGSAGPVPPGDVGGGQVRDAPRCLTSFSGNSLRMTLRYRRRPDARPALYATASTKGRPTP